MTSSHSLDDRRSNARLDGARISVALRPRGRLGAISANAVDFNRHGIAVHTTMPLTKDRMVYLTLRCGNLRLDNLVGVVHNCVRQGGGFRSGIRFRPASELQHDKQQVEALLACLETSLVTTHQESA